MNRQEGSQAERTVLAWDRTALALLGNGALLMLREVRSAGPPALAAAGLALVAALVVAVLGRRRARALGRRGAAPRSAAPTVAAAGVAVVAVGVAVAVVLLVG